MHAEGDGYRVFWASVWPERGLADHRWAENEIFTVKLDAAAEPLSQPQWLTTVTDGGGTRPFAFPRAEGGYTLIDAAAGRVGQHAPRWDHGLGPRVFRLTCAQTVAGALSPVCTRHSPA